MRPPASVEKLYTATTALERMGASARLAHHRAGRRAPGTRAVCGKAACTCAAAATRRSEATSFIHCHYGGVGASVSALVAQLVRVDGIHRVTGSVEGDESYFDSLRGEPSSGYARDPFLEGTLSALAFNRGGSGSERGSHAPAAYAARELRSALKNDGVSVHGSSGAATTPAGAPSSRRCSRRPSPSCSA